MSRAAPTQPLEYRSSVGRRRPPMDADARRWLGWRIAYRIGLLALFAVIAFFIGPNRLNFGHFGPVSTRDFVPVVQQSGVPIVRAMKAYQRDQGSRPNKLEELQPRYLPADFLDTHPLLVMSAPGEFSFLTRWNHVIDYRFEPGSEGWYVHGPYVSGRIPLPVVTLDRPDDPTGH